MNAGLCEPGSSVFMGPDFRRDDVVLLKAAEEAMGTREIVEALVAAVNSGKPDRIMAAMHPDAVFIDSLGDRLEGRAALREGWSGYLRLFPDYRIGVEAMFVEENEALLHGWAGATLHRGGRAVEGGAWRIPAAWRAVTDARRITLWQVYADNGPVAALLAK